VGIVVAGWAVEEVQEQGCYLAGEKFVAVLGR
jgi:hypothetical protein